MITEIETGQLLDIAFRQRTLFVIIYLLTGAQVRSKIVMTLVIIIVPNVLVFARISYYSVEAVAQR